MFIMRQLLVKRDLRLKGRLRQVDERTHTRMAFTLKAGWHTRFHSMPIVEKEKRQWIGKPIEFRIGFCIFTQPFWMEYYGSKLHRELGFNSPVVRLGKVVYGEDGKKLKHRLTLWYSFTELVPNVKNLDEIAKTTGSYYTSTLEERQCLVAGFAADDIAGRFPSNFLKEVDEEGRPVPNGKFWAIDFTEYNMFLSESYVEALVASGMLSNDFETIEDALEQYRDGLNRLKELLEREGGKYFKRFVKSTLREAGVFGLKLRRIANVLIVAAYTTEQKLREAIEISLKLRSET